MEDTWQFLLDLVLLMAAAAVLGGLMERVGQSALIGYLAAGMLLGPGVLNLVGAGEGVHSIAELGVAMLLFSIGLEVSWHRLKDLGVGVAGAGALQIALTTGAVTLVALWLGWELAPALVIGLALAPSSTACVLRLLNERGEIESLHGRTSLGILLLQDMALVPMVILVTALGSGGGFGEIVWQLGKTVVIATVLLFVLIYLGRSALPWVVSQIVPRRNREIPILLSVTVCIGATWGAHALNLSPAFGAFVAGMFLAGTPYAVQIRAEIGPLRTVFVALFFASVGMFADPRWMASHAVEIVVLVLVLLVIKTLITWLSCRIFGRPQRTAFATGVSLAQGGEFGFVLGEIALGLALFTTDDFRLMASVALVTLLLTPMLVKHATDLAGAWERGLVRVGLAKPSVPESAVPPEERGRVIVIGFGPIGQRVSVRLQESGVQVLVVDANPANVAKAKRLGQRAEFGDATLSEFLDHLHLEQALAVVITVPDLRATTAIMAHVKQIAPLVPVFARARYHVHSLILLAAGAEDVIDEEMESGLILGDRVLRALDVEVKETPDEAEA